jgi:hypothetical protein
MMILRDEGQTCRASGAAGATAFVRILEASRGCFLAGLAAV